MLSLGVGGFEHGGAMFLDMIFWAWRPPESAELVVATTETFNDICIMI